MSDQFNGNNAAPAGLGQSEAFSDSRKLVSSQVDKLMGSRTKARARAVDTLYEAELKGFDQDPDRLLELIAQRKICTTAQTVLPEMSVQILEGIAEHIHEIDLIISQYSKDWAIDRMPPVDLAIMRVGVWEIRFNPEIDAPLAISEAAKIGRVYSGMQSAGFINALLDSVAKEKLD